MEYHFPFLTTLTLKLLQSLIFDWKDCIQLLKFENRFDGIIADGLRLSFLTCVIFHEITCQKSQVLQDSLFITSFAFKKIYKLEIFLQITTL